MAEEAISKYNINFVREVFFLGNDAEIASLKKLIKPFYFLHARDKDELENVGNAPFFVVVNADFTSPERMQATEQLFQGMRPEAHLIAYVLAPVNLSREHLLFAQEIGARFVCSGSTKQDDLKEYLKRVCVEAHHTGALGPVQEELFQASIGRNKEAVEQVILKLKAIPETEETLRLQTQAYQILADFKRTDVTLKKILRLNPQNLWAANTLGRLYLKNGRALEGVEILRKMSLFHELSSERFLTLGDAQLSLGQTDAAEASFKQGAALAGDDDPRFQDGLAKVQLARNDFAGAISCLSGRPFSDDLIAFLNMRAIMSIKEGHLDEGLRYYQYAIDGTENAPEERANEVKAKLCFNMGLAYARSSDLVKAAECFRKSCEFGGDAFQKARGPLAAVTAIAKTRGHALIEEPKVEPFEEAEWETLT